MLELFGVSHFRKKLQSKEADGISTLPQLTQSGVHKEGASAEKGTISFRARLTEAEANPVSDPKNPSRFRVVLIKEGLGNFGDCYFYTKQAIASGVPIFEGKKCYANHPSAVEEQTQPERTVRDIIGHYENVTLAEVDGQAMLEADLVVLPGEAYDWARTLMTHALAYSAKYPTQDFIGLSINANGDADEVTLETFIQQSTLSETVKAKLTEALAKGITVIRPVSKFTSAVSCDLVTEAGAGGRIAQMLEQEKKAMKKESVEKKEADPAAADDAKKPGSDAGQDPGHADADQDKELIKSMLMKYLGDGHDEETVEMAKQAYEAALEMGMDEKEAEKAAGYSMKLAKHMAGKKPAAPAPAAGPSQTGEDPDHDGDGPHESKKEGESKEGESEEKKEGEAKKESARLQAQIVKLTGENAQLKEKLKGFELGAHLDKVLQESRLPMSATKKFRECLGVAKSVEDIDSKFKIFQEAYQERGGEAELPVIILEKQTTSQGAKGLDLSGCVKKED